MTHFKVNSRFASLIDEPIISKKIDNKKEYIKPMIVGEQLVDSSNSFKNNNYGFSQRRSSYGRNKEFVEMLEKQELKKKLEEEKRKEEEKMIALSIDSFPEFIKTTNKVSDMVEENTTNFIEKLKSNVKVDVIVKDEVKQGWTELTREKNSNETKFFYNKNNEKMYKKTQTDLAYDVVNYLVYLHEKRRDEYINCWGEDEWEKMFTFPNYDYHYFDKLDEIYAKNNKESENDYESEQYDEDEY